MIHKRRYAAAIDNPLATVQPEQVRVGIILIQIVSLFFREIQPDVLYDPGPFANLPRRVATV